MLGLCDLQNLGPTKSSKKQKMSPEAMVSCQLVQTHHGYITKHQKSHLHVKKFIHKKNVNYDMQQEQHLYLKVYIN